MTYKELTTRWRTEKIVMGKVKIINEPTCPEFERPMWECKAGVGELLAAYLKHRSTPWWRRGYDWDLVERRLRTILNGWVVTWEEE